MKKLFFILITVFLVTNVMFGQSTRFALTASPIFSFGKSHDAEITNNGVYLGLNYGIMADFVINGNERYAFRTGFTHTLTGAKLQTTVMDTSNNIITVNQNLKYQYIDIPLTIALKTNETGYFTYYGLFGFTPGFKISSRIDETVTNDPNGFYTPRVNEKLEGAQAFNVSLTLGGGLQYSFGSGTSLIAGLEYNNGFTSIWNDKDGDNDDKLSLRNITLRLGFLF